MNMDMKNRDMEDGPSDPSEEAMLMRAADSHVDHCTKDAGPCPLGLPHYTNEATV